MRLRMEYAPTCPEALRYVVDVVLDPMTTAMHAPVDEIVDGWMARHVRKCRVCMEATIEGSQP